MTPVPPGPGPASIASTSGRLGAVAAGVRVLGFARWIVFGATVGATHLGNAYQTANWVPNVLFDVIAGGLLSSVLVPAFVRGRRKSEVRESELVSGVLNLLLVAAIPIVVAGFLLRVQIMQAFTVAVDDPMVRAQVVAVGATLLGAFLLQIPFYMLGMVLRGHLHANDRFFLPQITPAFASIVQIGAYIGFWVLGAGADVDSVSTAQLNLLGWGTTLGVVLWAVVQIPACRRLGWRWRPTLPARDPEVRGLLRAGAWGLAWFGVTQIGFVGALVLSNGVEGGVVAFQIAFAFYELPNALVGFPVATTAFPALARHVVDRADTHFSELLSRATRLQSVLLVPAAVGLASLAPALLNTVFLLADPGRAKPALIAAVLTPMAIGLPAYALTQTLVRAFYARNETAPPVLYNAVNVALFLAVATTAAVLIPGTRASLGWLGGAHAAGQWVGAAMAAIALAARVAGWNLGADAKRIGLYLLRAAVTGAVALGVVAVAGDGIVGAAFGVALGFAAYVAVSFREPALREIAGVLRR